MLESIGNFVSTYQVAIARTVILLVVFGALQISAAVLVYFERKIAAWTQQRLGPNRVGPVGALQPLADIVKLVFKEELRPKAADAPLFYLAPLISAVAAFAAFVVVPFGGPTTFFGLLDQPIVAAGDRRQRRGAGDLRDHLDGRLRHRARRLELEQQIRAARRPALVGADAVLRAVVRAGAGLGADSRQLAVADGSGQSAGGLLVARRVPADPEVVPDPAADRLPDLHDRRRRRNEPRAVRLPGSGAGARRRLSHGIQLDGLRAVLPGRIHQHGDGLGGRHQPVSSAAGTRR